MTNTRHDRITASKLPFVYQFHRSRACVFHGNDPYVLPVIWSDTGWGSAWAKTIRLCQRNGVNPIRYVQWAVAANTVLFGSFPEPSELPEARRMRAFAATLEQTLSRIHFEYKQAQKQIAIEYAAARAEGDRKDSARLRAVADLASGTMCIEAYAYLRQFSRPRLARATAAMRQRALFAYSLHTDEYASIFPSDRLPLDFATDATAYYDELIGWTSTIRGKRK